MTNSVDPDQTAPIGAFLFWVPVCLLVSNVRQLFAADDFSRHFQMHFSWRFIYLFFINTIFIEGDPISFESLSNLWPSVK